MPFLREAAGPARGRREGRGDPRPLCAPSDRRRRPPRLPAEGQLQQDAAPDRRKRRVVKVARCLSGQ